MGADRPDQPQHTTGAIAERLGGRLVGPADMVISSIAALHEAQPTEITLITNARYAHAWRRSPAGAAVVTDGVEMHEHDPDGRALIFVPDAELASADLLELFAPEPTRPDLGVHPTAWVHETAVLGAEVRIGPHVSVERDCTIGDRAILHAGVRLYHAVQVGADSVIHAGSVIRERCTLGDRVILHQNVSIGADGFGYRPAPDGRGLVKMPHIGDVKIDDDVEIGAGSCVDRAKFGTTRIGAGTKIDNLVQIAHNCRVGRCCVIAGHVAFAGSVTVGDGVMIGGGAKFKEHVTLGDGARVGGQSGVTQNIPAGETWFGFPARPIREMLSQIATIRKLPRILKSLTDRDSSRDDGASTGGDPD